MDDWLDHLTDPNDDLDRRKAERLARVLRRLPGDEAMKLGWCLDNLVLLEACADRDGALEGRARSGAIVSHAIRAYRVWWRKKEHPQQAGKRAGMHDAQGNVVELRQKGDPRRYQKTRDYLRGESDG